MAAKKCGLDIFLIHLFNKEKKLYKNLKLVKIDYNYCNYLRKYDYRVSYNDGLKELRPFIGILFTVNKCEYFAPLSSPKEKHKTMKNTLDVFKISDGEYGIVNFNNMIPVTSDNYVCLDLNENNSNVKIKKRIELLNNQLRILSSNKKEIYQKSSLLYNLYKNNKLPLNVKNRCCNFPLLEIKCKEYNKM